MLDMSKLWKIVLVLALAVGLLMTSCVSSGNQGGLRTGSIAPDFRLTTLDGQTVTLSSFKGKPVLINFWRTTCPPCVAEMPHLQATFDEWSGKGLVFLSVNLGEEVSTVRGFIQSNHYTFPVLLDGDYSASEKYNFEFIPTSFFIDRDGTIQSRVTGAFRDKTAVEKYLAKIMP